MFVFKNGRRARRVKGGGSKGGGEAWEVVSMMGSGTW
jgi:hypothetical protein